VASHSIRFLAASHETNPSFSKVSLHTGVGQSQGTKLSPASRARHVTRRVSTIMRLAGILPAE
jgi:hypothetical protein